MEGPPLRLVATEPPDGAGLDCELSDTACGVPTDVTIALTFDRFLLPETAIRQSIAFYLGDASNPVPTPSSTRPELTPHYDLKERTVRYELPAGFTLQPNALYTVELPIFTSAQPFGFRAFDGAALAGSRSLRFSFFTRNGPRPPSPPAPAPSCEHFVAELAGCARGGCHSSATGAPAMGLALDSVGALRTTALRRSAHQTELGPTTGEITQAPLRFGINMPVIDPGRPDNSYLMYKLLLAPEAYIAEEGACPPGDRCEPPDAAELERLVTHFVRGEPMPWASPEDRFVHHSELSAIQAFIASGNDCERAP